MATNVWHTYYLDVEAAWMAAKDIRSLFEELGENEELPEACFLEDLYKLCEREKYPPEHQVRLQNADWAGEFSGSTWEIFLSRVAPLIDGEVVMVVVWDDSTLEGIEINNNHVTRYEVDFEFGDQITEDDDDDDDT